MKYLLCLLFLFSPLAFSAERLWLPELDASRWVFNSDKSRCDLSYQVNGFGNLSLVAEPGEAISLHITPNSGDKIESLVSVESIAPPWHTDIAAPLAYNSKAKPRFGGGLKLEAAQPLYDSLSYGDWLWISLRGQGGIIHSLQVTNVDFSVVAEHFNTCRSQLLPISYGSARNMTFSFLKGSYQVGSNDAENLALIAELIANDSTISKVLIDGYAGDYANRVDNLRLSQQRAEEVASLLVESGVPLSKLEIRWHGERYPISDSSGQSSRKNRHTTLRLIKKVQSGDE